MPIDLTDPEKIKGKDEYVCVSCNTVYKMGRVCRKCWPEVDNYK